MTKAGSPTIAIVGGGLGGIATAAFLARQGLRATVYEQASRVAEVGAGIIVSPNAIRLIRRLGHADELIARSVRLDVGWEFRRWSDGTVLSSELLKDRCAELYGEDTFASHRAHVLDALLPAVPKEWIQLGRQCVSISRDVDGASLLFADGTVERADVVIGADGVHSVVRGFVTDPEPPVFSGMCAFRANVPIELAPDFARSPSQILWLGPGRHVVHYPIDSGRTVNVVAYAPAGENVPESWTAHADTAELLAEFAGWDDRLVALLRAIDRPARWALLDRPALSRWGVDGVTLIGDAAHAMYPFFGQGAAQAIEDAAALASSLARHTADPWNGLRVYEERRRPRASRLQALSRERKDINHLPDGPEQRERDKRFAAADPLRANAWIYAYDPEADDAAGAVEGSGG